MIVPLWVGGGIRTKILAAWGASCPVVATTIGAEGLPGQVGEHFMVGDDAPSFASDCVELAQDVHRLNHIASNGLELVQKNYSLAAVCQTRMSIYNKLLEAKKQQK